MSFAYSEIPGLRILPISIGNYTLLQQDVLSLTPKNASQSFHFDTLNELAFSYLSVTSKLCEINANPCGECCGLCLNGDCLAPDLCESTNFCEVVSLPTFSTCCATSPYNCQNNFDLCVSATCDPIAQKCQSQPISCIPDTPCYSHACQPLTGLCASSVNVSKCSLPAPECTSNVSCDDGNACTVDICNPTLGKCEWTHLNCDDGNACSIDTCNQSV